MKFLVRVLYLGNLSYLGVSIVCYANKLENGCFFSFFREKNRGNNLTRDYYSPRACGLRRGEQTGLSTGSPPLPGLFYRENFRGKLSRRRNGQPC